MENNCLNFKLTIMKKIVYILAFIAFATILTSCTADELPTSQTGTSNDNPAIMARDGEEIDPPKVTPPPPPPPPSPGTGR